jgi:hypothetical protein
MPTYAFISFNPDHVVGRHKGQIVLKIPKEGGDYAHVASLAANQANSPKEAKEKPSKNAVSIGVKHSTSRVSKY